MKDTEYDMRVKKVGQIHPGDEGRLTELVGNFPIIIPEGEGQFYLKFTASEDYDLRRLKDKLKTPNPKRGCLINLWDRFIEGRDYSRGHFALTELVSSQKLGYEVPIIKLYSEEAA